MRKTHYTVLGGKSRSGWTYLEERQLKGFRYYRVRDFETGEEFYAADFRLCGIVVKTLVRLEGQTRTQAWEQARALLYEMDLPEPVRGGGMSV